MRDNNRDSIDGIFLNIQFHKVPGKKETKPISYPLLTGISVLPAQSYNPQLFDGNLLNGESIKITTDFPKALAPYCESIWLARQIDTRVINPEILKTTKSPSC